MPQEDKRLFLLDAFALIYRSYFAFSKNPRYNSKGMNTSAVLGFTNTLVDVLNKEKPTHIAVCFDMSGPTVRHEEFSEYKAGRDAMPEDISLSLPYIREIIKGFNIPLLEEPGYEADDVIGTLAKKAEKDGYQTYMMTPDKDYGQLISENIFMYKPSRMGNGAEIWGVPEICEKFEVERPEQVIDILGLMGDAVDNIPGVPGVGEKTAKKLIKAYGSIEGLYENTHELKGKLKENVENNKEQALMSKSLATIILDVPVPYDEEDLIIGALDKEKLRDIFAELEFKTLARKVLNEEISLAPTGTAQQPSLFDSPDAFAAPETPEVTAHNTLETTDHTYHLVEDATGRKALIEKLEKAESFCFDTETTGLDALTADLVGISFAIEPGEAWYVAVPETREETTAIVKEFAPLFANEKIGKTAHNIKYDMEVLMQYGISVKGPLFDTMLAHYLLRPDMRHNMDLLAEVYLSYKPVSIETLIGKKGKQQKSMRDVPLDELKEYAGEDADITLQLRKIFEPQLEESDTKELFETIEMPLVPVLCEMEYEGINLDVDNLKQYSKVLLEEIIELETAIHKEAGVEFNISSPKQLGEVLYERLKIVEKPKKTKTGQYSTSEDTISQLEHNHPIIRKILDFRQLNKLKSTYVDSLPELVNPTTNHIHTSYNQAVAATGRLSSNNPNLQNIPIRTARGKEVRKAFIPRDSNHVLLAADYSQIELRIIAELSGDKGMIDAFQNGEDIHRATAAKVFAVAPESVDREMRSKAKAVNFGIIYGQSAFGLAGNLNISRSEAAEIIKNYFVKYPGIKTYMDKSIEFAREHGYVETMKKRRRYLVDINSRNAAVRGFAERNAINAPIQGSAADMIKIAMINIQKAIKKANLKSKMILQVHDELVFDVFKPELDELKQLVESGMKNAMKMKVPILVEMDTGSNWLEAH